MLSLLGFNHPQGQGRIVSQIYSAWLDCYIPINIAWYPYICLITRNSYIYYPPYPTKLPIDLANNIVKVIRQVEVLSLTIYIPHICTVYANKTTYYGIGRFILSPQYYTLCKKYRAQTLRAVYSSLNIKDRITTLIQKERML